MFLVYDEFQYLAWVHLGLPYISFSKFPFEIITLYIWALSDCTMRNSTTLSHWYEKRICEKVLFAPLFLYFLLLSFMVLGRMKGRIQWIRRTTNRTKRICIWSVSRWFFTRDFNEGNILVELNYSLFLSLSLSLSLDSDRPENTFCTKIILCGSKERWSQDRTIVTPLPLFPSLWRTNILLSYIIHAPSLQ